ncbi:hypothetical protein UlMin_026693 [Ulmus minor]
MENDDETDSPAKCRERRRQRIEKRRLAMMFVAGSLPPENRVTREDRDDGRSNLKRFCTESCSSSGDDLVEPEEATATDPVFGIMSVLGMSRHMEDAVSVRTRLCRPEISRRRTVHFFAVYDGHGGSHVAGLCREWLHVLLLEELMRVRLTRGSESGEGSSGSSSSKEGIEPELEQEQEKVWWRRVMERSFEKMDQLAINTCACGSVSFKCGSGCQSTGVKIGGSTAVVAVLTPDHIVVANCGDSRAVLCRGGRAIALSNDHKPDREDELARIEGAGGRVIFLNGARVEGVLAMSRAIGDTYLKPIVTSKPEITFTKREPEDECLVLASDGLWDVLSNEMACEVASRCLREGTLLDDERDGALYPSRSALAAALLTRLALGRKSSDNVSVIVVDLKQS